MSRFVILALIAGAAAREHGSVTPMEKVIGLITDLRDEVAEEGKAEAKAYDEFACFCKEKTGGKSLSITTEHDTIDKESASVETTSADKDESSEDLSERKASGESLAKDLADTNSRCAKTQAEYEATAADLNKALSSLHNAEMSMTATGGGGDELALLQTTTHQDLINVLKLADAMGMIQKPKHKATSSLIQGTQKVDPDDPDYKYHSNQIVELLQNLGKEFQEKKDKADDEWAKQKKGCDELKASLADQIAENESTMHSIETDIDEMSASVAEDKGDIVSEETSLEDDEDYLKDLTKRCEQRAHEWDQRTKVRNDELIVLENVLETLTGKVQGADEKANKRALLQEEPKENVKPQAAPVSEKTEKVVPVVKAEQKPISLLQKLSSEFLAKTSTQDKALQVIAQAGQKLASVRLVQLVQKAQSDTSADPFKKVKELVQGLTERLIEEARAEATKKGFCDTALGKARNERGSRWEDSQKANAQVERLEAKKAELEQTIKEMTQKIKDEQESYAEATKERTHAKEANLDTIKTAKNGKKALDEATALLKNFYKAAAKSKVAGAFIQVSESPVAADEPNPGFSGGYNGKQAGNKAVFALLETISSDFERTIRTTTAAEEQDARDFVGFARKSKIAIAEATTKNTLSQQDLRTTKDNIASGMRQLESLMSLLDTSLKEIASVRPMCIDNGMSYKERVEKREQEMDALNKALKILTPAE